MVEPGAYTIERRFLQQGPPPKVAEWGEWHEPSLGAGLSRGLTELLTYAGGQIVAVSVVTLAGQTVEFRLVPLIAAKDSDA